MPESVSVMVYAPECPACMGLGAVCSACGLAFPVCECGGIEEPAEGAECETCGGSGEGK